MRHKFARIRFKRKIHLPKSFFELARKWEGDDNRNERRMNMKATMNLKRIRIQLKDPQPRLLSRGYPESERFKVAGTCPSGMCRLFVDGKEVAYLYDYRCIDSNASRIDTVVHEVVDVTWISAITYDSNR